MLRKRIEEMESWHRPRVPSRVASGLGALDALLPGGGLRRGMLLELLSSTHGAGAWTLALGLARHACGEGQTLILIDEHFWFYPPAALRLGVDLGRCLVVRPRTTREAHAAMSQSLACRAVGGVVTWCTRIGMNDYQRLRLAAERGGGLGFLVRPPEAIGAPACASARLLVSPVASGRARRHVHVEVLRGRGRGQGVTLEIDDETGDVYSLPDLASATAPARSARPSG